MMNQTPTIRILAALAFGLSTGSASAQAGDSWPSNCAARIEAAFSAGPVKMELRGTLRSEMSNGVRRVRFRIAPVDVPPEYENMFAPFEYDFLVGTDLQSKEFLNAREAGVAQLGQIAAVMTHTSNVLDGKGTEATKDSPDPAQTNQVPDSMVQHLGEIQFDGFLRDTWNPMFATWPAWSTGATNRTAIEARLQMKDLLFGGPGFTLIREETYHLGERRESPSRANVILETFKVEHRQRADEPTTFPGADMPGKPHPDTTWRIARLLPSGRPLVAISTKPWTRPGPNRTRVEDKFTTVHRFVWEDVSIRMKDD